MTHHVEGSSNALIDATLSAGDSEREATGRLPSPFLDREEEQTHRRQVISVEERNRKCGPMAGQLHETPFREVPGASVAIGHEVEEVFPDLPSERWLSRVLRGMHRVIDKGRMVLEGVRSPTVQSTGLERALCDLLSNIAPTAGTRFRIIVTGRPKTLESAIQDQVYLIGREALLNALHHSEATSIEAELEYSARRLRVVIRDNGCGIEPQALKPGRGSHCGLRGMFERAKAMGARFQILSKSGSGTEVELSLPFDSRGKSVLNP